MKKIIIAGLLGIALLVFIFAGPGTFLLGLGNALWNVFALGGIVENSPKLSNCYLVHKNSIYFYRTEVYHTLTKIDADPETFKPIYQPQCFGKDKDAIYFEGHQLLYADPATFEPVPGQKGSPLYFRDKDSVFYGGDLMENTDPRTFTVDQD